MNKWILVLMVLSIMLMITHDSNAQIERYFRKSVSLFMINIPDDMTRRQGKIIYDAVLDKFISLGRFDYNPIPIRPGISVERLFEIVKEYAEDKQLERASKQFELMDEHYKEERITGETLDKIIQGAYIIIPHIEDFNVSHRTDKVKNKDGSEAFKLKVKVKYTLKVEVWNAENLGTPENPRWEPYKEDSFKITGMGNSSKTFSKKPKAHIVKQRLVDEAIKDSIFLLKFMMGKEIKKLDMFTIKAKVIQCDLKKDFVKFDFGTNVGLNIDDPFDVIYYEKTKEGERKKVNVAYMKLRKIAENEAKAQILILKNPYKVKKSEIINLGDQVVEHPMMGLNINLRTGYFPLFMKPDSAGIWMSYKENNNEYYFESDQDSVDGIIGLTLGVELNLGQFTGISELYAFNDNTLLLNVPLLVGLSEFGVRKRYYKRQLCAYWGTSLGVFGLTGKVSEVPSGGMSISGDTIEEGTDIQVTGYSIGFNLSAGFNYLISPEMSLSFDVGYRLYPDVSGSLWLIEAVEGDDTWELDNNKLIIQPPDAKISGLWYALGFIVSL